MIVRAPARLHELLQSCLSFKVLLRELNPGPLAPYARMIPLDQAAGWSLWVYSNARKPMSEAPTHRQMHRHTRTHTDVIAMFRRGGGEKKHPRIIYSNHCFTGAGKLRRGEPKTKTRGISPGVTASWWGDPKNRKLHRNCQHLLRGKGGPWTQASAQAHVSTWTGT